MGVGAREGMVQGVGWRRKVEHGREGYRREGYRGGLGWHGGGAWEGKV